MPFDAVQCVQLLRPLRIEGETDEELTRRAERAAVYAKILTEAVLTNKCIREFIADPALPYSEESERLNPTIRIDFEQAFAFAGIGEGIAATRNKSWGDGPYILPLEPDDPVDPFRVLYVFKEGSLYNRRFEQRQRMKELLGRRNRSLVEAAKYKRTTKAMFLEQLTGEQAGAIRQILGIEPGAFWRECRGKAFVDLPPRMVQLELPFQDDD